MRLSLVVLFTIVMCTSIARGQAFNIDIGGDFFTPPSDSYGAASDQTGYWNRVSLLATELLDLTAQSSGVVYSGGGGPGHFEIPSAQGNDELFMESVISCSPVDPAVIVRNLEPGFYDLYIYCWYGSLTDELDVGFRVFNGKTETGGGVSFDSVWPGGHVLGETYDVNRFEVLDDPAGFLLYVSSGADMSLVNGLQLVPVPAPTVAVPMLAACLLASRRRR